MFHSDYKHGQFKGMTDGLVLELFTDELFQLEC